MSTNPPPKTHAGRLSGEARHAERVAIRGILYVLAMHADHAEYFNDVTAMNKAAVVWAVSQSRLYVPNENSRDHSVRPLPNPHKSSTVRANAAFDRLVDGQLLTPVDGRGGKDAYSINEKGRAKLKSLLAEMERDADTESMAR